MASHPESLSHRVAQGWRSYARILTTPGVRAPAAGAAISAMPIGLLGLSTLLMLQQQHRPFSVTGLVVGLLGLGTGLGMTLQGRLIDRWGQTPVLLGAAAVELVALVSLVLAVKGGAGPWLLGALAVAVGSAEPQVAASLRALWADLVSDELRPAAFAISAILFEAPVLLGPLLVVSLLAVLPADVVVLGCAGCFSLGAAVMASSKASRTWRNKVRRTSAFGPLIVPGFRTAALVASGQGFVTGLLQLLAAAMAAKAGLSGDTGYLYAALSAGSLGGAAIFGTLSFGHRAYRTLVTLLLGMTAALVACSLAASLLSLASGLFLVGAFLGPVSIVTFFLVDSVVPPGTAVEGFTLTTAISLGAFSLGTAFAGLMIDQVGPSAGFACGAITGLGLLVAVIARRGTISPSFLAGTAP
jgi:MFS family permease